MIRPEFLNPGDKIAIVTPASHINPDYVDDAFEVIEKLGYTPVLSKHCKGAYGYYSGSEEERTADFLKALKDPEIKAILCSRGGYGTVHLVDKIHPHLLQKHPKWIIGFSDISIFHAIANKAGIMSLHASMAKHLSLHGANDPCTSTLFGILKGEMPEYHEKPHKYNHSGEVTGEIVGGNMAVLCGLLRTNIDIFKKDKILFIEDVGEPIYKIERMLYNLRLAGILESIKGLIVGRFTDFDEPDANGDTMNSMIERMVAPYSYPVAYNFPIGHIDDNIPIIEGATATLIVNDEGATLKF